MDSGGETAVDSGGETAEPCLTYAELLADCEALALPVQSNSGDYYAGIDPDSPTLATDLTALIDDQLFWGQDSTSMLFAYLENSDMFKDSEMARVEDLPRGNIK